jgi:transposase
VRIKYQKLSGYRLNQLIRHFAQDLTATQTARLTGLNRNTVNRYYRLVRIKIAAYEESLTTGWAGEVEIDESYFGGKGQGRRGRGTAKIPVVGLLKRQGRVWAQVIHNATKAQLQPIIRQMVRAGSTIYTDRWRGYDGLIVDGYRHYRVRHGEGEFSNRRGTHINGIENFWSFAKRRLQKFNGIRAQDFYLHLKECEFRYNERQEIDGKLLHIMKLF